MHSSWQTSDQLIPLPWDKTQRKREKEIVSAEEDKGRLEKLINKRLNMNLPVVPKKEPHNQNTQN
jgi:hypothetical protein